MARLRSTGRLFEYAKHFVPDCKHDNLSELIDAVHREIDERFMELPLDKDGKPIHIGDTLVKEYGYRERSTVRAIGAKDDGDEFVIWDGNGALLYEGYDYAGSTTHYRETIEDMLCDLWDKAVDFSVGGCANKDAWVKDVAERIRSLDGQAQ